MLLRFFCWLESLGFDRGGGGGGLERLKPVESQVMKWEKQRCLKKAGL